MRGHRCEAIDNKYEQISHILGGGLQFYNCKCDIKSFGDEQRREDSKFIFVTVDDSERFLDFGCVLARSPSTTPPLAFI